MSIKPSCLAEIRALPSHMASLIWEKIEFLAQNPYPDGHLKKKLRKWPDVYRLRVGDYRIFYSFGPTWIRLLGVRPRKDAYTSRDIQYEEPDFVPPPGSDPELDEDEAIFQGVGTRPAWTPGMVAPPPLELPRPITAEWLLSLGIPPEAHPPLLACKTEDDLLNAPVDPSYLERVIENLFPRPITEVMQQPDFAVFDTRDLQRYHEGDLIGFLLRLDPAQEHLVDWALEGPTLIKGGPGTGKSTVALYRVRAILDRAAAEGRPLPRILFTTYTPALARFSEQLLEQLLGDRMIYVTVETADALARRIVSRFEKIDRVADRGELEGRMERLLQQRRSNLPHTLARLRPEYLLDEVEWIIEGRGLRTLDAYLAADRSGRAVGLDRQARQAMWELYVAFSEELKSAGIWTPSQVRLRALELVQAGQWRERFDAVMIDEAQDLTPTALSLLVELAHSERGIYVPADSSQRIYYRGFSWQSVHERLRLRGRAQVLRRNYRSTKQIAEAARAFLEASGAGDPESLSTHSPFSGPRPLLVPYDTESEQWQTAAEFIRQMSRHLRLRYSSAAILVPSNSVGQQAEAALQELGLKARFMRGSQLDLRSDDIKILTFQAAKGLEFPIVVLAGLSRRLFPRLPEEMDEDERLEELQTARRTLFVAMTRAMRALMALYPRKHPSPLIHELQDEFWDRIDPRRV